MRLLVVISSAALLLAACGIKGPLVLPAQRSAPPAPVTPDHSKAPPKAPVPPVQP